MYFAGDTDLFEGMAALAGRVDLAALPIWGWGPRLPAGHLDPLTAAEAAALIRPAAALPIHWGTLRSVGAQRDTDPMTPVRRFVEAAGRLAPATQVRVLQPGERLELARFRRSPLSRRPGRPRRAFATGAGSPPSADPARLGRDHRDVHAEVLDPVRQVVVEPPRVVLVRGREDDGVVPRSSTSALRVVPASSPASTHSTGPPQALPTMRSASSCVQSCASAFSGGIISVNVVRRRPPAA